MKEVIHKESDMMNRQLLSRLKDKEDNFMERKPENAGDRDFKQTIVAFANSVPEGRTAVLFVGIRDDGQPLGVSNTDSVQKKIRRICASDCFPAIQPVMEVLDLDGKSILAMVIYSSRERPHSAGPVYIRQGSESVKASLDQYNELIVRRLSKCSYILDWKGKFVMVEAIGKYSVVLSTLALPPIAMPANA
jgi:predicted HTH transcriptional regulator